ncbi:MAG: M42 family metallopeptidase [Anaerolineae bacterium]|nr:M42 family metallopeptidase [Anaerolineae bacterium]
MSTLALNVESIVRFLIDLLNRHSPTGYHVEAMPLVRQAFESLAFPGLTLAETPKGALLVSVPGQRADLPRGLTAHADTLGLMVRAIKPSGRLKATNLGGVNWSAVETENVTVRTRDDRRYRGTVVLENPSTHVNRNAADAPRNADTMEIRLDARTTSADETRGLGIEVGDFIFLDPRVEITDAGFIRSRFLDDKAGVAAIYGALLALRDAGLRPAHDTHILLATYEEVGHGGAGGFPVALDELLAVDMGAIGQDQNSDEFSVSLCVKDGGGPYHVDMNDKLMRLAAAHHIPIKPDIYLYYSSDGTAYWRAGGMARVGLIGPGVDASHGYERTHLASLEHTAHLIARYLLDEAR